MKGDRVVLDIRASILNRGNRKHWYIRYQVLFENKDAETKEESTKVLKDEKNFKYMQTQYLTAWMAKKKNELSLKKHSSKKFSYFYQKFLLQHESDKSYKNRLYVRNKVNECFGDMDVTKITRLMIKEYISTLQIKEASKRKYINCIAGVLEIAHDAEFIDKNLAKDITLKREHREEAIKPFSAKEVSLLMANSEGMLRNFIGIALNTGMRSGEILGLMHQDITNNRISVKRSISRGNITSPKTIGSIRDIPMFEAARPFIDEQRRGNKSLFLFNQNGKNIDDISFFRYQWDSLLKKCEIEYRTIYNTRHTFITAMLNSEKFKIMDIAAIVGHSSPQMIMTRYAGFIKDYHLKVDTNIDLFSDTSSDTLKFNA